jgi:hypothetical protein
VFQQFVVAKQWEQEQHKSRRQEKGIETLRNPAPLLEQPGYEKNKLIS